MSAGPFFPAACHPALTRRSLLVGGGAALAASVLSRRVAEASEGDPVIRRYATAPEDPWAVAHGVRAMGRAFTIQGGRSAVDHLLGTYLAALPANGRGALGFPPHVEVHQNSFLKTLLEAGVPLDHEFTHQGSRRTLREVVEGARALFRPRLVASVPNALPWSIIALTRTTSPLRREWTNAWGEAVDLDIVVEGALRLLERASLPIAEAKRANRPQTSQAPVHAFTCGGTHMLYSLLAALHAGYTGRDRAERVREQVDLLVWRLKADLDLIEGFYKQRAKHAGAFWYEFDSKLKLLGHAEECLAFAVQRKVLPLTSAQEAQRRTAVVALRKMLADLEARDLGEAKAIDRELFKQLVGDTCHARHGLTFA